jgi:NAD(P)H-hydrate epimerase
MVQGKIDKLDLKDFLHYLAPRQRQANKGNFGHVLIVGGDYGYSGAVRMAGEAALRIGAGLVSIATRPEHALMINASRPELMCHGVTSAAELEPLLARATVIIVGPGMGRGPWAQKLLYAVLKTDKEVLVVDADGLNLLADKPTRRAHWILTPHPGEAARLLKTTTDVVQTDRLAAALQLQAKFGGVAVLKGAGTIVVGTDAKPAICYAGNPGMATGGMGDVLSGVIGGLLAQGLSSTIAAKLGVIIHALAGDRAAKQGGERGLLATDLMPYLRELVNES